MSENITHRSYNDFSNKAIYTAQGIPSDSTGWTGWQDEYNGDTVSTPITAENLNAMLNMLIYIRNVVGKTDDFKVFNKVKDDLSGFDFSEANVLGTSDSDSEKVNIIKILDNLINHNQIMNIDPSKDKDARQPYWRNIVTSFESLSAAGFQKRDLNSDEELDDPTAYYVMEVLKAMPAYNTWVICNNRAIGASAHQDAYVTDVPQDFGTLFICKEWNAGYAFFIGSGGFHYCDLPNYENANVSITDPVKFTKINDNLLTQHISGIDIDNIDYPIYATMDSLTNCPFKCGIIQVIKVNGVQYSPSNISGRRYVYKQVITDYYTGQQLHRIGYRMVTPPGAAITWRSWISCNYVTKTSNTDISSITTNSHYYLTSWTNGPTDSGDFAFVSTDSILINENLPDSFEYKLKQIFVDASGIEYLRFGTYTKLSGQTATITYESTWKSIANLDVSDEASGDNKWVTKVTQTDGLIDVEYAQPDASNISYNDSEKGPNLTSSFTVNNALNTLDDIIGNLSEIKYSDVAVDSVSDALMKEKTARSDADKVLLGTGSSDSGDTIKKNRAAIDAINDESTGIKATVIGTDSDTKDSDTIKGAKKYTEYKIAELVVSDEAKDKSFVTSVSQVDGKISVTRKELTSNDIPLITHEKISDFETSVKTIEVNSAIKAEQDSSGNKIVDTYATKEEISAIELLDSKVKMSDDLRITESFGKYNPDVNKGYVDIICKNKTVREFLLDALQVASVGTIDYPSYTYSTGYIGKSGEVGSSYSAPTCTFKVTDVGSYQYGPATGIVFNGTLTADNVSSVTFNGLSKDGTASITAERGGTYSTTPQTISFGGTYEYGYGKNEDDTDKDPTYPNTNIETVDRTKYIPKKTDGVLSQTCKYIGYYKMFMGIGDASSITSANIRALEIVNEKESKSTKQVNASINDKSIIWAIRKDFTSNKPTFTYELFGNYETLEGVVGPIEVDVKDGGGVNDVKYNVYTYTPALGYFNSAMKTQITIN